MVSTRGVKFKFSEGEKVLCYEPDPTKAKVLYDSKVLEVIVNKDSRGRKNVEYLIHFQGWNSSWDRCVGEDYVLKDTEDNRRLQRTLADKAQLQLRERKQQARRRKTSDRTSDGAEESSGGGMRRKRRKVGGGGRGRREEDSSGEDDDGTGEGLSSDDDDDGEDDEDEEEEEEEDENEGRVPLTLSENLIKLLEEDRDLITCRNKLVKLPASPNAVQILENFMKQYALNQIFPATMSPEKRKSQPRSKHHHHSNGHKSCRPRDFTKTLRSLNLCKEVVDGIRIYFDHTLSGLLLYAQEKEQYEEEVASLASLSNYCRGDNRSSNKNTPTKITIKQEQINSSYEDQQKLNSDFFNAHMEDEPKSSYVDSEKGTSDSMEEMCLKSTFKDREAHHFEKSNDDKGNKICDRNKDSDYKEDVFKMSNDIKTDFLASFSGTFNNTMSSAASTSSCCSTPSCTTTSNRPHSYLTLPNVQERPASINSIGISASETGILKRIMSWKMIPESSGIVNLPSQLYGAIHLVRLFVKLPDLLYAAGIQEKKLKVLLGYLHNFLEYLEEHTDWFGDFHYKNNPSIYT